MAEASSAGAIDEAGEMISRAAFRAMSEGIVVQAQSGEIVSFNPSALRILGLTADQLLGRASTDPRWNAIHEDGTPFPGDTYPSMVTLRTGEPRNGVIMGLRIPDADVRWLSISTVPLLTPDGGLDGVVATFVDVTERKRLEEHLRESGALYRSVIENATDLILLVEGDGTVRLASPSINGNLGYDDTDVVGTNIFAYFHPDEVEESLRDFEDGVRNGFPTYPKARRIRHKNGTWRHFEYAAVNLLRNPDVRGVLAVCRDVTERQEAAIERQRAEEALRESESRARARADEVGALMEAMPAFVFMAHDPECRRITSNRTIEELVRVAPGGNTSISAADGDRPTYRALRDGRELLPEELPVQHAAATGQPQRNVELTLDFGAGGQRHILGDAIPLFDERGAVRGAIGAFIDITYRKRAEESLKIKEAAIASSLNGIAIANLDGQLTYANQSYVRMWGYETADQILGMRISEFVRDPTIVASIVEALTTLGQWVGETVAKRKDGSLFHVQLVTNRVDDESGRPICVMGSFLDITERKGAEAEIRRLNQELEDRVAVRTTELEVAVKEMEEFSYSFAHDLRAPIRAINGFAAKLDRGYGDKLDDEGMRLLTTVRTNARRMGSLIDDLLEFSRLSRLRMKRAPVDMTRMVEAALAQGIPAERREGVHLIFAELPPAIGDAAFIRVVLRHLVANAVKFSATREHPVIEVGFRPGADGPEYFVKDNGVGFDMKYAGTIFGVFKRLHGMDEFPGTGIGLALVKQMVERHGGRVWAEGEVDRGATFWFTLGPEAMAAPIASEEL